MARVEFTLGETVDGASRWRLVEVHDGGTVHYVERAVSGSCRVERTRADTEAGQALLVEHGLDEATIAQRERERADAAALVDQRFGASAPRRGVYED